MNRHLCACSITTGKNQDDRLPLPLSLDETFLLVFDEGDFFRRSDLPTMILRHFVIPFYPPIPFAFRLGRLAVI